MELKTPRKEDMEIVVAIQKARTQRDLDIIKERIKKECSISIQRKLLERVEEKEIELNQNI